MNLKLSTLILFSLVKLLSSIISDIIPNHVIIPIIGKVNYGYGPQKSTEIISGTSQDMRGKNEPTNL
jgi:hypothetical protein